MIPTTMFGRQPRAVLPPTSAPEIAPAKKPTTIHPMKFISSMGRVLHDWPGPAARALRPGTPRRPATNCVGVGVVGGVAGAVDDDDAAVGQPPVEARGRVAEDRQARAAEELEDRLADGARAGRARRPGSASASSSRRIVPAAAARRGQTGSAR